MIIEKFSVHRWVVSRTLYMYIVYLLVPDEA